MINVIHESEKFAALMGWSEEQALKLAAVSITQAAYNVQAEMKGQMRKVFHNPKPFVLNSVYVRQAKINGTEITPAEIGIRGTGGKLTPAHVLYNEIYGGARRDKRSEDAMARIMPLGRDQWVPGAGAPLDDGRDIKGGYMRKVLSALHASQHEGHTARTAIKGTTGLTRKRLTRMGQDGVVLNRRTGQIQQGLRGYDTAQVARFLASKTGQKATNLFVGNKKGKGQKGTVVYQFDWQVAKGKRRPNDPNPRDVLKKVNIKPVLVFTRTQRYKVRLPFFDIAAKVAAQDMAAIVETKGRALMEKWGVR